MTGNAIREALEPFAKALEEASIGTPDTVSLWFHPSAMGLTVGDLRRARTAYDAIGSGVKALEWSGDYANTSIGRYAICRTTDGYEVSVDGEEIAHLGYDAPRAQPSARDAARDYAQADFERRVLSCLSTHTAAGAEPVGEAVAWREFVLSRIKALGEGDQYGLKSFAIAELQSILDHAARPAEEPGEVVAWQWRSKLGPDGWSNASIAISDPGDLNEQFEKRPLYTCPVEEPGEVERLTRERDALAEALEQINSTFLSEVFDGRIGEIVSAAREVLAGRFDFNAHSLKVDLARETKRAETAEAALAETRERLEKVEAAAGPIAAYTRLPGFEHLPDDHVITQGSRLAARQLTAGDLRRLDAALTGPAQDGEPGASFGARHSIAHDGFVGTVIGHYTRLDGKRGVVLQQDGTKVVHVYGEKWLAPAGDAQEAGR